MEPFDLITQLNIGKIIEISGTTIRVELDEKIAELTRSYNGCVYPIGQIASIVKIHFGRQILFAYVRLLRMRSAEPLEEGTQFPAISEDSRILEADIFGEGSWDKITRKLNFNRGVKTYPLPLQNVYITTQPELQYLYEGAENNSLDTANPMIELGSYTGVSGTTCRTNLNKLFGHHLAVLGSTGSGKSATVAAIIHSVLKQKQANNLKPRIVIIDPHGEYTKTFASRSVTFDTKIETTDSRILLQLPYWLMSGDEFRKLIIGKTQEEATSQNNIIYKAIAHARMVSLGIIEASKEWIGNTDSELKPYEPRPMPGYSQTDVNAFDRDKPIPFCLDEFINHITNEQGLSYRSNKWAQMAPSDFDKGGFRSVLDKLSVLRADPRMNFMMENYSDSSINLPKVIEQFIGKIKELPEGDIRVIDVSGLPNEVAGPLTALIGRLLFQYKVWQSHEERKIDPILLVCEEAHRYVPNHGEAEYAAAQQAIRQIATQGRKYGIGLMLISQRPADVESTVLSQCNTWLVLRLTNDIDQSYVNRFLPDSLGGLTKLLSSLPRREAIFVGEAAAIPARITIRKLEENELPASHDISFADGWSKDNTSITDIESVTNRWCSIKEQ